MISGGFEVLKCVPSFLAFPTFSSLALLFLSALPDELSDEESELDELDELDELEYGSLSISLFAVDGVAFFTCESSLNVSELDLTVLGVASTPAACCGFNIPIIVPSG